MSYTLKKLKQSEIDRGYRKPPVNKKTKPSYGLFIACFAIILALSIVFVERRKDIFSQQIPSSPEQIIASSNETLANSPSKNLVNERIPGSSVRKEKKDENIKITDTDKVISANQATEISSVPSIISEHYLSNLLAEDKFFENSTTTQLSEKNSIEKSEQVINLATYVNEQSSLNEKNAAKEKKSSSNNQLVLWQDLPTDFRKNLPEMNLNGIAFLDKVEDRYIFINMDKYQVDDLVDMGPSVEEIRQNSVIMEYKNRRFILSLRDQ